MVAAAADDGRRRVAAEEWARFGSGRDKWLESWESRENMLCIRADEVSNSDRQAWEYSSSQEKLLEQIGRTCLSYEMCKQALARGCGSGGVQAVSPFRGCCFGSRAVLWPSLSVGSEGLQGRGRLVQCKGKGGKRAVR